MNILFDVYDSVGGVTVDTETIIPFDQARIMRENVSLLSGEVTVSPSSFHFMPPYSYTLLLIGKVTLNISSGTSRSQSKAWLEVDIGGGYSVVPGTEGYMYNRTLAAGLGSTTIISSYSVDKSNDLTMKFRVRAQRTVGTSTLVTLAQSSNFIGMVDL